MLGRVSGALSFERATSDMQRITTEIQNLQRQMSGRKADDLKSFSGSAGLIISARSALAEAQARQEAATGAEAQLSVQDVSIVRVQDATENFRLEVLRASTLGEARGLKAALDAAVGNVTSALNTTWGGRYLFGGERGDARPVTITTSDELQSTPEGEWFATSNRPQITDLGEGPFVLSETAETIGLTALQAFAQARNLFGPNGEGFEGPLSKDQAAALRDLAATLETARTEVTGAVTRNGQVQRNVEETQLRLERRVTTLESSLGAKVDADLAEVAIQLTEKRTQYEAIASVIGQLRDLNLLNYLR